MDKETMVLSKIMPIFLEHYELKDDMDNNQLLEQIYSMRRILNYIQIRFKSEAERKLKKLEQELYKTSEFAKEIDRLNEVIIKLRTENPQPTKEVKLTDVKARKNI